MNYGKFLQIGCHSAIKIQQYGLISNNYSVKEETKEGDIYCIMPSGESLQDANSFRIIGRNIVVSWRWRELGGMGGSFGKVQKRTCPDWVMVSRCAHTLTFTNVIIS
jgi:hypothetical protein